MTQASTTAQRSAAIEAVKLALRALPESTDLRGLRVDVAIHDPTSGADYWVDTSTVHTSSLTHLPAELNSLKARKQAALVAAQQHVPDLLELQPSPAVVKREQDKIAKYAILTTMAHKQVAEQKRQAPPVLFPFVLTDNGEFGPAADALQEVLVETYRKQPYHRLDGVSAAQRVIAFRQKFRNEVAMALAAGLGAMACNAGVPWGPVADIIARGDPNLGPLANNNR